MSLPPRVIHVIERAQERYGLRIDGRDVLRLERLCREREGLMQRRADHLNPAETWFVEFEGVTMRVVYNRDVDLVVTILPIQVQVVKDVKEGRNARREKRRAKRNERKRKRMEARGGLP